MERVDLLFTFDRNCISPFKILLNSLAANDPGVCFHLWLIHSRLTEEELNDLSRTAQRYGMDFHPILADARIFADAPVMKQYPKEMYYRLLAAQLLPQDLQRVLYLDPDVLVLRSLLPLWRLDLQGKTFAACSHSWVLDIVNDINRLRLETKQNYCNTGVILMDLTRARNIVKPKDIFRFLAAHGDELFLPDQDVFNSLYDREILILDDKIWNYDPRYYAQYLLKSENVCDLDWMMRHTAILYFCGKHKPWRKSYRGRFAALYKHYQARAEDIGI